VKISLHIGQIVIEGASLTRREREQLATAIEQELVRGLAGGARPARPTDPLGLRIAHEVLTALPRDGVPRPGPGPAIPRPAIPRHLPAAMARPTGKGAGR